MKMQNELRAPFEGNVARLKIKAGEGVQQKQALLTIVAPITSPSVEQK
jgi:biotin carboxyl carrier protein